MPKEIDFLNCRVRRLGKKALAEADRVTMSRVWTALLPLLVVSAAFAGDSWDAAKQAVATLDWVSARTLY